MRIILGSKSPRRATILKEMGYEFEIMPSHIDEKAIKSDDPSQLALLLARAKADAVLSKIKPPAILITADLIVLWDGQIRGKPKTPEEARQFLIDCSQSESICISGVFVINCATKVRREGTVRANVWINPMPEHLIDELIASGDVYEWGGGFEVSDPRIAPYLARMEGDRDTVMGLPVKMVKKFLEEVMAR